MTLREYLQWYNSGPTWIVYQQRFFPVPVLAEPQTVDKTRVSGEARESTEVAGVLNPDSRRGENLYEIRINWSRSQYDHNG